MRFPSLDSLNNCSWYVFSDEPVETSPWYMPRLTHPAFLLPEDSPDGLWHLFAHTWVGIQHYISTSGLTWEPQHIVIMRGHAPCIYKEGKTYYLIYENHNKNFGFKREKGESKKSRILISSSTDLKVWSTPKVLVKSEKVSYSSHFMSPRLSRPQLVPFNGKYRLYFGSSIQRLFDSKEQVITYLSYAESENIDGPFVWKERPILVPDLDSKDHNLAIGSCKIIPCSDGLAALACSYYYDVNDNKSHSALFLLTSSDGDNWSYDRTIMTTPTSGWASGYLSSSDCVFKADEDTWYCYFSAFEHKKNFPLYLEKESLGLLLGKVKN